MESGAFYDGIQTATVAGQKGGWDKVVRDVGCSSAKDAADCVAAAPTAALLKANANSGEFGWSITVDGVDLTAPGPVLASQGKFAKVPIIAGSVREDIASPWAAIANPGAGKLPTKMCDQNPEKCSVDDFQAYGISLGFNKTELAAFLAAYTGPPENGKPTLPEGATDWYWAIHHAGSDAWATCPARRISSWYTNAGVAAYWYYWTHVPDGPNGHGGAHHANEQPFVFHVLSETAEELKEDGGKYHINASNPLEVALSVQTVGFFAAMAGAGTPGASWPSYDETKQAAMIFGDASPETPAQPFFRQRKAKCAFWDEQFQKVLTSTGSAFNKNRRPSAQAAKALKSNKQFRGF